MPQAKATAQNQEVALVIVSSEDLYLLSLISRITIQVQLHHVGDCLLEIFFF